MKQHLNSLPLDVTLPIHETRSKSMKQSLLPTIIVLVSCNLVLLFVNLKPQPTTSPDNNNGFEPISFFLSRLTIVLAIYLSSTLFICHHTTVDQLLARIHRTWQQPAATLLCIELYYAVPASLALTLSTLARSVPVVPVHGDQMWSLVALLVFSVLPTLFPYSDIACKVGLVASVVEEGCEGAEALRRGLSLVEGVGLQGLAFTAVMSAMQQVPLMVFGGGCGSGEWCLWSLLVAGPAHLAMKLAAYFGYTLFYLDCKRRKKGRDPRRELLPLT